MAWGTALKKNRCLGESSGQAANLVNGFSACLSSLASCWYFFHPLARPGAEFCREPRFPTCSALWSAILRNCKLPLNTAAQVLLRTPFIQASRASSLGKQPGQAAWASSLGKQLMDSSVELPPDVEEDASLYEPAGGRRKRGLPAPRTSKPGQAEQLVLPPPVSEDEDMLYSRAGAVRKQARAKSRPRKLRASSASQASAGRRPGPADSQLPSASCVQDSLELPPPVELLQLSFIYKAQSDEPDAVMEVFSPPRLVPEAVRQGLQASVSLDKDTGWDANLPEDRLQLQRLMRDHRPVMLMLSPECRMFSILTRNVNLPKMDPLVAEILMTEAVSHVDLCMDLALQQHEAGRFFVMEHPAGASSWKLPSIQRILHLAGVWKINFAQCRYGLTGPAGGPMKKLTSLLTNMESVANEFQGKQCQCKQQGLVHERIEGSYKGKRRSRHAQVYPKPLVTALVSCCHTEMLRGESEIMAMRHEFNSS